MEKIYKRTIKQVILSRMDVAPIVLLTGARQVGKTDLLKKIEEDFGIKYVAIDKKKKILEAQNEPDVFLSKYPTPVIIDEVQRAPDLFVDITGIVNEARTNRNIDNSNGLFILCGSQKYELMKNVKESMAGRVTFVEMPPLSQAEIREWEEKPFSTNIDELFEKSEQRELSDDKLYESIIKGFYPELWKYKGRDCEMFYDNYLKSYLDKDVSLLINLKDQGKFINFLKYIACLTGQELVVDNISKETGIARQTIESWINILVTGDIIRLLSPYYETSIKQRIIQKNKIFFNDTGLACYLIGIKDKKDLLRSNFKGHLIETYIHNEIRKSLINNGVVDVDHKMFYYRDTNQNEIDLILFHNGGLNLIECKSTSNPGLSVVRNFKQLLSSSREIVGKCIICTIDEPKKITAEVYAFPIRCI